MSSLLVSKLPASDMSITIPRRGCWVADVVLSGPGLAPTAAFGAAIVFGDLALTGTVVRQGTYAGANRARIVGGAGGWRKSVPAVGYSNTIGVLKSHILGDAARDCGEKITLASDGFLGTSWARKAGAAERTLRWITKGDWWIDAAGTTRTGPRPSTKITSAFTATERKGGIGQFEIASEAFSDWMPGRTFSSPLVPDAQVVNAVSIKASAGGAARLTVLVGPTDEERVLDDLRAVVDSQIGTLAYAGLWSYTIAEGTPDSADITPRPGSPMPQLTGCRYLPGLVGEGVTPAPGSTCYVQFVDQDPGQPRITAIEGAPLLYEQKALVSKIGAGARPAAAMGDLAGPFPIVATAVRTLI